MRRALVWILPLVSLLLLSVHAIADTHLAASRVETHPVRFDEAYDATLTWHANVSIAAPLGAKLWPRLAFEGAPLGYAPEGAQMPELHARLIVDGEPRWEGSWIGDVSTWSGALEIGACTPKGSCDEPPIVAGFGTRHVAFEVRILNEPQRLGGSYRYVLGPLDVETDRGPWLG